MGDKKIIFTNGCFDILHRGHFELLNFCKSFGGLVVVGLNSDKGVSDLKGEGRPYNNQDDRAYALSACKFVDDIIIFEEDTPLELIKKIQPDIIVKGGDYKIEEVAGHDIAEVKIFDYIDGYSTTDILRFK